jgi:hypothetical protein
MKKGNMNHTVAYILLFVIFAGLGYLFVNRETFVGERDKSIHIQNRFTKDSECNKENIKYCSKYGKVAINNFNQQDGGCMCADMESGV